MAPPASSSAAGASTISMVGGAAGVGGAGGVRSSTCGMTWKVHASLIERASAAKAERRARPWPSMRSSTAWSRARSGKYWCVSGDHARAAHSTSCAAEAGAAWLPLVGGEACGWGTSCLARLRGVTPPA
eukprot:scaffold22998_cov66-Phaeocystis_antarctica.AAC.3